MDSIEAQGQSERQSKHHWKSIEEFNQDPKLAEAFEKEFMSTPQGEEEASEGGRDGVARRDFLKLMSAAMAMTTTACVRRPVQKIVPYSKAPEEIIPGVANYYSSSWAYSEKASDWSSRLVKVAH